MLDLDKIDKDATKLINEITKEDFEDWVVMDNLHAMEEGKRTLKLAGLLSEVVEYDFKMNIPDEVKMLYNIFKKHNFQLLIVGGAVRDGLMGMQNVHDHDLVSDAKPDEIENILTAENIYHFPSGKNFGIISAVINNQTFEIATFRTDDYSSGDGRRPSSVTFSDMQADSQRRDMRHSSLFFDIGRNKIIDYVGGVEDIKNKITRAVGDPMSRLAEDKIRGLRFIRFSNKLGHTLDNETIAAIMHFKDLPGVSNERIRDEFIKGLNQSIKPEKYFSDYVRFGLMPRTFPGLQINTNFITVLRNPVLVVTTLSMHNSIDKVVKSLKEATWTSNEIDSVVFLLKLKSKLKDLDRLIFDPNIDGKWFGSLFKERDIVFQHGVINHADVMQWADIAGINKHLIDMFLNFRNTFSAKDFPNMSPSKELGDAISFANAKSFLEIL